MQQMQLAPSISGVGTALPENYVSQEELTGALRQLWMQRYGDVSRFDRLQGALGIQGRYLALPMRDYYPLDSFAKGNDAWLRVAPELAEAASRKALNAALRGMLAHADAAQIPRRNLIVDVDALRLM